MCCTGHITHNHAVHCYCGKMEEICIYHLSLKSDSVAMKPNNVKSSCERNCNKEKDICYITFKAYFPETVPYTHNSFFLSPLMAYPERMKSKTLKLLLAFATKGTEVGVLHLHNSST